MISKNNRNISLLSPIARNIKTSSGIIIIGNGLIFDIDDWVDKFDLTLIRVGNDHLTINPCLREFTDLKNFLEPYEKIQDQTTHLNIQFQNNLPFFWDNPNYRWDNSTLEFENDAGGVDHHTKLKISEINEKPPYAVIQNRLNRKTRVKLTPIQGFQPAYNWIDLSEPEIIAFRQITAGSPYDCPICKQVHEKGIFTCNEKDIWGNECVYFFYI